MLITLVNTKSADGKFVLHKYPYQKMSLDQLLLYKNSNSDIQTILDQNFDQFGTYRKPSIIPTSSKPLPASAVLQLFIANEKNSQVVLGIDDDCVLVSRSITLSRKNIAVIPESWSSENASLTDLTDQCQSIVNSITVIWRLDNFDGVEQAKHRLSFLLGVLQRKEEHNQYLTKEIKKVLEEKENIKRRIKDLIAINAKNNSQSQEEIRIKILTREIEANASRVREKIGIFQMLREYYDSWINGKNFEVRENEGAWEGTIGRRIIVQAPPINGSSQFQQKTLVILPPKLVQMLPNVLYSQRVKHLYQKGLTFNHLSFKKLLQKSNDLNSQELYHTVNFLVKNNLAVEIYPINQPYTYNLFYLRNVPHRNVIDKFNRIFPAKNFMQVIDAYSKYKLVKEEQQTMKYLLVKQIIGEVKVHVYKKYEKEAEDGRDSMLQQLLSKYNMSEKDLNYLLLVEPFGFSKESSLLNNIIKYIKQNHKQWGFYFVQ